MQNKGRKKKMPIQNDIKEFVKSLHLYDLRWW